MNGLRRPAHATCGTFHYQLEPAHAGKHLIRAVSIEFVDRRPNSEGRGEPALIETDPLEVNVTSEFGGQAPSLANLEPMLPPEPVPAVSRMAWLGAAGVAGLLAIVAAVVLIRRRRRRPIEAPGRARKKSPRRPWRGCWQRTCRGVV